MRGGMAGRDQGFTIIEFLIAFSILTVFFLGVLQVIYRTQQASAQANYLEAASSLMTYIGRDIAGGEGEVMQFVSSTGASVDNTPACNTMLGGSGSPDSRGLPPAMVRKAFGALGLSGNDYNDPTLYSASIGVRPQNRFIGGITYRRATYTISVFFPAEKGRNCLSTEVEAQYR